MNSFSAFRNRIPSSTVTLVVSAVSAWLIFWGTILLIFGFPGPAFLLPWPADSISLAKGALAIVGGAFLFGWLLTNDWRGPLNCAIGYLIAVVSYFIPGLNTVFSPVEASFATGLAILGGIIAATALLLSHGISRYGALGIAVGLSGSMLIVLIARTSPLWNNQSTPLSFVFGWVTVVFCWQAFTRQTKWWDVFVWILLIVGSLFLTGSPRV